MDLRLLSVVALGAAVGGVLRWLFSYYTGNHFGAQAVPLMTLFINLTGSFAIGIVLELSRQHVAFVPYWRGFLATGILGGYTTFSTFSFEAITMLEQGAILPALLYVVSSVAGGMLAAFGGVAVTRLLVSFGAGLD